MSQAISNGSREPAETQLLLSVDQDAAVAKCGHTSTPTSPSEDQASSPGMPGISSLLKPLSPSAVRPTHVGSLLSAGTRHRAQRTSPGRRRRRHTQQRQQHPPGGGEFDEVRILH